MGLTVNCRLRELLRCKTFVAVIDTLGYSGRLRQICVRILLLLVVLGAWPRTVVAGSGDETLPTDHWANDMIYELYAAGVWGPWPIGTRPWYRGDIAERLTEISEQTPQSQDPMPREHHWLLAILRTEFDDLLLADASTDTLVTRIGGDLFGQAQSEKHVDGILRGRTTVYTGVGTGLWWVQVRGDIDSHGDFDPTFFGRRWKDHLTGTIDLGLISWRRNAYTLTVGRDAFAWGSGSHDLLLLNDQSPPFDLVRLSYHHKAFDFSYFLTGLDGDFRHPGDTAFVNVIDIKRYFAGHRLELRPTAGLEIGFTEVVVWGGPGRQLEAFYLNPFLPYYWEQLNAGVDDNPLWSIDVSYIIPRGPMIYGELLVDDFQIDFTSEAHQLGWMVGLNWSRPLGVSGGFLTFDWSHIEPTVFGQNRPYNRYMNHRIGIGSDMGPDADRLFARYRHHLSPSFGLVLRGVRTREGERDIATPQDVAITRSEFPTGVVETTSSGSLTLKYRPDAHFELTIGGGYRSVTNLDHVDGSDRNGGFVQFSLQFSGWRTGKL
jgi:hypothetical protein